MNYAQLNKEHIRLLQVARNCAIEFGVDSREFIEATQEASIIGQRIHRIDMLVEKKVNSTGNYSFANN